MQRKVNATYGQAKCSRLSGKSCSLIDKSHPSVCNNRNSALVISRVVRIRAKRAHVEFFMVKSFVYCGKPQKVSAGFHTRWQQTFVAKTRAAMKIRSHTRVVPKDLGSRRVLTRSRYAIATNTAENLEREEVIIEQMKPFNCRVCRVVPVALWPVRRETRDDIKCARLAKGRQEVQGGGENRGGVLTCQMCTCMCAWNL